MIDSRVVQLPSVQQLAYLVALADHGHFGRAAAACHVTQPGLSSQVRELERRLGCVLVERSPRAIRLTPVGEQIADRARRVLRELDDLTEAAQLDAEGLVGAFRLGLIPTVAPYVLPDFVAALLDAHPRVELQLVEDRTDGLVQRLRAGELDAVVMALPVEGDDLRHVDLGVDPFLLAVPAGHRLARAKGVDVDVLADLPVLLLEEGHCLREQALSVCHLVRTEPTSMAATSLPTLVQMVAAGQGVTLLPATTVALEAREGSGVVAVPLRDAPSRTLALVWRATSPRAARYAELAGLLRTRL